MNNKLKTIEMIFRFMDDETKEELQNFKPDTYNSKSTITYGLILKKIK